MTYQFLFSYSVILATALSISQLRKRGPRPKGFVRGHRKVSDGLRRILGRPKQLGYADFVCRLTEDVILFDGWASRSAHEIKEIVVDGISCPIVPGTALSYDRPDVKGMGFGLALAVKVESASETRAITFPSLGTATGKFLWPFSRPLVVEDSIDGRLAFWEGQEQVTRQKIYAHLFEVVPVALHISDSTVLQANKALASYSVNQVRTSGGKFRILSNFFAALRPDLIFLAGWIFDPLESLQSLCLVSAAGQSVELKPLLVRVPAPEIDARELGRTAQKNLGFLAAVPVPASNWEQGAKLIAHLGNKAFLTLDQRQTSRDPFKTRQELLQQMPPQPYFDSSVMQVMQTALTACQSDCEKHYGVDYVFELGKSPSNAATSIVIPLYKRMDFVRHQIVHFANDLSLRDTEFIYVLDSPEDAEMLKAIALSIYDTYRMPFRVVVMRRNSGFGPANNTGARYASGRNLLFLNSDIFPVRPGWLDILTQRLETIPNAGSVGCKLLFEDRSLQHAGMFFNRSTNLNNLWWNWHYYKGLPSTFRGANVPRAVPALTGALLLMKRDVFEKVGGWDESYVAADFEDSDLSIRLYKQGLCAWYEPTAELWHLEAQSRPDTAENRWRRNSTYYNCWLQSSRWSPVIEEIMRLLDNDA